jgi:hypothetical protein
VAIISRCWQTAHIKITSTCSCSPHRAVDTGSKLSFLLSNGPSARM